MRPWRSGFFSHLEGNEFFGCSAGFLPSQNRAAGKFPFFQADKKAKSCLDGGGSFIQFMAIEGVADFGSKRVARAKPCRLQAMRCADGHDGLPDGFNRFCWSDYFKSIFAGVAGARDPDLAILSFQLPG